MLRRFAVVCALIGMLALPAHAEGRAVTLGALNVTVWEPQNIAAKAPVILFSHGFHGCATQSQFLMEAFAAAGYIVFAPNHRDATCSGGEANWRDKPAMPFGQPEQWSLETYRDRGADIHALVDAIKADPAFRDRVDWSRFGLAGHSLGGYTVLALAGAWSEWKLPGVKAALALSPYGQPFIVHKTLGSLAAPVMYQGGTRDFSITPSIKKNEGSYDQSPAPKYFVEFEGAGHMAWTDVQKQFHESIVAISVAFMDHYVRGQAASPSLTQAPPNAASFRFESELGNAGTSAGDSAAPRRAPGGGLRERLRQRLESRRGAAHESADQ